MNGEKQAAEGSLGSPEKTDKDEGRRRGRLGHGAKHVPWRDPASGGRVFIDAQKRVDQAVASTNPTNKLCSTLLEAEPALSC
jgi:hypothetical protein